MGRALNRAGVPIVLIAGPPAVGKSSTSRALAARFARSLHISVDDLRMRVVSGLELPADVWSAGLALQVSLARQSAAAMAAIYHGAGFAVVIDDFWDPNHDTDYAALLDHPAFGRVLLHPGQQAAHDRNRARSGEGATREYLDAGIRAVYRQLRETLPHLEKSGWSLIDSTELEIEEVVESILERAGSGF